MKPGSELILAGDIGATKTRLGLFAGQHASPVVSVTYATADFESPVQLVGSFLESTDTRPTRASFGVAGVVLGRRVPRINLPWDLQAAELERQLGLQRVTFVNDVEANARGILALGDHDFTVLQ